MRSVPETEIASRVAAARSRLGWSREALAYHSGVSWSAIAQIESGRRSRPRPGTLLALARALGVSVGYLLGDDRPASLLAHRAVVYDSDDAFAEALVPFVREGVDRAEPVLVVTSAEKTALLGRHLTEPLTGVTFADSRDWYRSPQAALTAYRSFAAEETAGGAGWIRIVGEPTWPATTSASRAGSWATYESLFNFVFASAPLTVVCPYDSRSSRPSAIDVVRATHPYLLEGTEVELNDAYVEPERFLLGG